MRKLFFISKFYVQIIVGVLCFSMWSNTSLMAQNAPVSTIAAVVACPGDVVSIPVKVTGFNNIASVTLYILYDTTNMTFISSSGNSLLIGLIPAPPVSVENSTNKRISVSYVGSGVTLPDNSTLVTYTFLYGGGDVALVFENTEAYSCEYSIDGALEPLLDDPASSFYFDGGVTAKPLPAAGTISGPSSVVVGTPGLVYSTPALSNAVSYLWTVPSGFSIVSGGSTATVTVDASASAVSGNITVQGINVCGIGGQVATYAVSTSRQLSVKVFPEGLFNGTGLNKAQGASGAQFAGTIADKITIKLHDATNYNNVVYTLANADLSTGGMVSVLVPAVLTGEYFISLHHRNSLETVSASAISFSPSLVSYDFSDAAAKAFGNNLKPLGSVFVLYGGDVNQDGIVDGLDLIATDNKAALQSVGYLNEDINGDGVVNDTDMQLIIDNVNSFVARMAP